MADKIDPTFSNLLHQLQELKTPESEQTQTTELLNQIEKRNQDFEQTTANLKETLEEIDRKIYWTAIGCLFLSLTGLIITVRRYTWKG